jgi:hypothetical protein
VRHFPHFHHHHHHHHHQRASMFHTINIVTPAPGREQRVCEILNPPIQPIFEADLILPFTSQVREMLDHLVSEVQKNEPDAISFRAVWDASAGVYYVIEKFVQPYL